LGNARNAGMGKAVTNVGTTGVAGAAGCKVSAPRAKRELLRVFLAEATREP
jgi:hypothetical protein